MTKNNFLTNLKETNSNRFNRRSLIGHHRMANLLQLISLLKNAAWTSKNSISTKASSFQIFLKKNGLPTKNLKTRDDIVIKPADKGGAVVVWRTDLYKQEAFRQLADTKFYAKVNKDPTQANQKIVKDTVNKLILEQKLPSTTRNLYLFFIYLFIYFLLTEQLQYFWINSNMKKKVFWWGSSRETTRLMRVELPQNITII